MPRLPLIPLLLAGLLWPGALSAQTTEDAGVRWLPSETLFPRLKADPREPRFGLGISSDPDRFDGALGGPVPVVRFQAGEIPLEVLIEASAIFRMGRQGRFFPLLAFDGYVGLGFEARRAGWRARLRLFHHSAHLADGAPNVAFPAPTFSREFAWLDLGWSHRQVFVYGRLGWTWHAIPTTGEGPAAAVGAQAELGSGAHRLLLAVHVDSDAEREWHPNTSLLAAWITGQPRRFLAGLRYYSGHRNFGQSWYTREEFLGIEFQLTLSDEL